MRKILKNDLGIDTPLQKVPYQTENGAAEGMGIKLTREIKEALDSKGLPYFVLPGGVAILGTQGGEPATEPQM